jgi:RNA methyltransferase, TrmH family
MPRKSSPPTPPRRRGDGSRPAAAGSEPAHRPRAHERDLVAVCGLAAVTALFAGDPERVERLVYEPQLADALLAQRRALAQARRPYREAAADELARIAGTVRHGGVVAVARPRPLLTFDPKLAREWAGDGKPLLILDGIGNPHNLGAVVRSAAYFGVARIVLADRPEQALPSAASYRIAEGALDRVMLYRAPLGAALPSLKPVYRIVGTALDRGRPLGTLHRGRPVALILGNEERGVDPAILALCDTVVTIPGDGRVQSLNVAAAAAVLLYALTAA